VNGTGSKRQMPAHAEAPSASPSAFVQEGSSGIRLLPNQPPGRRTRKAFPFADEIRRLYAMGYTLEAIRQALSAAGVSVSRSTVHREVRRRTAPASLTSPIKHAEADGADTPALSQSDPTHATRVRDPPRSSHADVQIGKKGAEAFFTSHESNPLFPTKETS
jgi:hypothetical protein